MDTVELIKALPVNCLIEKISKAIGVAYEPRRQRNMADAEAYRIKVIGKAIEEQGVPVVYDSSKLTYDATDFAELQKRALCRFVHQEIQRQINIESIADKAFDLLSDKKSASSETVSDNWIARFIDASQDVSDDDIRAFWSRILAGEILQPKTISLRTLDILKNLSAEEAGLFEKIIPYVINQDFLPNIDEYLSKCQLNYWEIMKLDECGLINSNGMIAKTVTLSKPFCISATNDYALIAQPGTQNKVSIPEFELSFSGKELLKILDTKHETPYFLMYANLIKEKSNGVSITCHKIIERRNGTISYDQNDLLESKEKNSLSK